MAVGALLILAALFLMLYNWNQDYQTEQKTGSILEQLKEQMPDPHNEKTELYPVAEETAPTEGIMSLSEETADGLGYEISAGTSLPPAEDLIGEYLPDAPVEEVVWWINGDAYLGTITIPALGLELPVLSGWNYSDLRVAPCRYSGTVEEGNLVIAAHNYSCHFGRISELNSGAEIIFTDGNGVVHTYSVVYSELINGSDASSMQMGDEEWDLTLFTCNLSGTSRVTVRAALVE